MMEPDIQERLDWIANQQERMVALTEQWASINSGSYHAKGIRAFRAALEAEFSRLGGSMEIIPLAPLRQIDRQGIERDIEITEALRIRKRPEAPVQVLLVGHMDTVYGPHDPFQTTGLGADGTLNGPGVADLKGGLVVMLTALEALEGFSGNENLGWEVLLNPDEEIGSQSSDPLLKQSAAGKHLGLVYEPALADGSLAGARKGSGNFTLVVKGKAAHAGRNPEDGRNAIVACAELTLKLFDLNGKRQGVTLNPGKVEGGGALNTVPDLAILRFNIRTQQAEDEAWILKKIQEMTNELSSRNGFSATLHGAFTRAPKPLSPANRAVFDMITNCAADLGLTVGVQPSGGCCDGNNLWRHGLPNVDTLGVRGAHIHSPQEIMYTASLTERAQLSALLLMRLASGALRVESIPPSS